jgi:hypothetical protein
MTSSARIAANLRNAQKSIGPKTVDGKAAAAGNALRHGLTAQQLICSDERMADFINFEASLRDALAPVDEVEEQLVERIVLASWRLRRVARAEPGLITTWITDTYPEQLAYAETPMARMFRQQGDKMATLSRYEASLDRALGRAYALLDRRQARRRGEHVAAPLTVLVEGPGDFAKPLDGKANYENCETKPILATTADNDATR